MTVYDAFLNFPRTAGGGRYAQCGARELSVWSSQRGISTQGSYPTTGRVRAQKTQLRMWPTGRQKPATNKTNFNHTSSLSSFKTMTDTGSDQTIPVTISAIISCLFVCDIAIWLDNTHVCTEWFYRQRYPWPLVHAGGSYHHLNRW